MMTGTPLASAHVEMSDARRTRERRLPEHGHNPDALCPVLEDDNAPGAGGSANGGSTVSGHCTDRSEDAIRM
jgi:hypothetical protein